VSVRWNGVITDNSDAVAAVIAAGGGIGISPTFVAAPYVRRGELMPLLSEFLRPRSSITGSTAKATFSVRAHVEHSKVRSSNPRSPGKIRAKAILWLHTGHIGRSSGDLISLAPAVEVHSRQDQRTASITIGTQASRTNWSSGPCENAGLRGLAPSPHSPPKAGPRPEAVTR
jgi:hypothetical protein